MNSNTESDIEDDLLYKPKISSPGNYRKFLGFGGMSSLSDDETGHSSGNEEFIDDDLYMKKSLPEADMYPDLSSPAYPDTGNNGGATAPPAVSEEQKQEWNEELQRVEGEIATLRQVLASKVRYSAELKRKLGITPLQEIKHDFQLGLQSIKESAPYQKTSAAAKSAAEKTSTVVAGIGRKLGDLRNSQTFKSVEGRVESAYASVKAKVSGSKSEGNFEEALQSEKENNGTIDPAKEAIPEEKQ
ncbi:tumor protein D52-like isoform X2 [Dreissena polymorpha]|uniref:tumor protein D52-like isoform X2 n=1 Tax=Dreissena polymorpha TaxID=45954 RepID=UPI0022642A04|nr:tumor protein D52-like isoform X2 [Dreissena polymorpha]